MGSVGVFKSIPGNYTNIDSNIPKDSMAYKAMSEAQNFIIKQWGKDIVNNTEIVLSDKRTSGERMYYDGTNNSIIVFKSELNDFNKSYVRGASDIIHEYGHALEQYIMSKEEWTSVSKHKDKMKSFISDVSKDSGIKLTQNKIKELFGNYATKNGNEEFLSMTLQKGYENNYHLNTSITSKHIINRERQKVYNSVVKLLKQKITEL